MKSTNQVNTANTTTAPQTFFYVFVDETSWRDKRQQSESDDKSLDSVVVNSFRRLKIVFEGQVEVNLNPEQYHKLRKAFGIKQLPAFGVSDVDLSDKSLTGSESLELPSVLYVWAWRTRKEILNNSRYLPKVERNIIGRFENSEELFHFIRDLHFANVDHNLVGVSREIEKEIRRLGGQKLLNAIHTGKKVFFR
jgi:hypothetical protein